MSVTTDLTRTAYAANGTTAVFAVPWYFTAAGSLLVILRDSAGLEFVQVEGTDYTVAGVAEPAGGTVTMVTAPPTGTVLWIIHDPDLLQDVSLIPGAAIPIPSFERQLDKLAHVSQRTRDLVLRSPRLGETDADGAGVFDARGNRIGNAGEPVSGSDLATKTYVLSQTIVSAIPPNGSLTNAMWNAASKLAESNVDGETTFAMGIETDPFPAGVLTAAVNLSTVHNMFRYQVRRLVQAINGGALPAHAYVDVGTDVPTQISAAIAAAFVGQNRIFNGSLMVSQRFPSESATGTVATGVDAFVCDRWFLLPTGGTVTWNRVTANLHTGARSPIGLELVGAAGITNMVLGTRLGRAWCRKMGALLANKNVTFGVKVRHDGTTGSLTPTFYVRSTSNTGADSVSTKFAAGNMTTRITQAFPGALTSGTEVSFKKTFDLGAMTDGQNGIELLIDFGAMNAATIKFTVTDLWIAEGDLEANLLPDDYHEQLESGKRYYQKTFGYAVQPAQNAGYEGALAMTGNGGATEQAFQWKLGVNLSHASWLLGTYNPAAASTLPQNRSGDLANFGTTAKTDSGAVIGFVPTGHKEEAHFLHCSADAEWYD